jgi:hypothetical protein
VRWGVPVLGRLRRCVVEGPFRCPGPVVDVLGRVGMVGYGVVHLLVAWLALQVAIGVPRVSADAQGAVGTLARTRFGGLALGIGAAGLIAFALWQLTAAAIVIFRPAEVVAVPASLPGILPRTARLVRVARAAPWEDVHHPLLGLVVQCAGCPWPIRIVGLRR